MKYVIKELLLEFHHSDLPNLIERQIDIPQLPPGIRKARVLIGMRRVGKTYAIYQDMRKKLKEGLDKTQLLYLNFEDDRLSYFSVENFQQILEVYFELYPQHIGSKKLFFYFDEIQDIEGWEKFIRRLLDKESMEIFITGSSAKLLSKDIATSLRGRCLTTEIFPLSFSEYLRYRQITFNNNLPSREQIPIKHQAAIYLRRGGFPETLDMSDSLCHQTLQSYVNTTVFRDVIERHKISEPHIVKMLLMHCLQNTASSLSVTKIHKDLQSRGETVNRNRLYVYFDYFEDAYLLERVPIFDFSVRKRQVNPSKIYCADPGIIDAYSIKPSMEEAARLENAVYIHLRRQRFENIFYYKTASGKEIDFIAQKITGQLCLYQVSVVMDNAKTREREVSALIEAAEVLNVEVAYIITFDTQEVLEVSKQLTIYIVPYWQWALQNCI